MLAAPAIPASSRLSVTSIRTRRMRGAPSERRTAISRRREAARESSSVATLAQAMRAPGERAERKVSRNRSRADAQFEVLEPGAIGRLDDGAAAGIERVQLALQTVELGFRHGARVSGRQTAGQLKPEELVS